MTREEINAFADAVKSQLLYSDAAILVQVGAYPPNIECDENSCTATIEAAVGRETLSFTGHAIELNNAIWLARGKLREARAKHEAALALEGAIRDAAKACDDVEAEAAGNSAEQVGAIQCARYELSFGKPPAMLAAREQGK